LSEVKKALGKFPRKYVVSAVAGGVVLLLVVVMLYDMVWSPNTFSPSPAIVTANRGESFIHFVDSLEAKKIVASPLLFKMAGRLFGFSRKLKVNKYSFPDGVSNIEILYDITEGKSLANPAVTIYEGLRDNQIAHLLHREAGIDSARFMHFMSDTSLIGIPYHGGSSLEGFLLPDTYDIFWQTDEKQIVEDMLGEFREFFVDSLQRRAHSMGLSIRDVLTMASIVEGETSVDSERAIIAGLYYNRLHRRMKLEADPTIQYIVPNGPRRLEYEDLRIKSPYNTYLNYGLPPGPINNPGRKSILAALYPEHNHYLYFVAKGNGGHRFARTYSEHLRNVRLYRKARALEEREK
jgi:peptidoglycan lytic transglycosylase G